MFRHLVESSELKLYEGEVYTSEQCLLFSILGWTHEWIASLSQLLKILTLNDSRVSFVHSVLMWRLKLSSRWKETRTSAQPRTVAETFCKVKERTLMGRLHAPQMYVPVSMWISFTKQKWRFSSSSRYSASPLSAHEGYRIFNWISWLGGGSASVVGSVSASSPSLAARKP